MTPHALLFTLAAIGIAETIYLIRKRIAKEKPVCILGKGEDCQKVLESKYNKIFLLHNEIWGLIFYVGIALFTALFVIGIGPLIFWNILIKISIGATLFISIILTYLQWQVIKIWCDWCVLSALLVFAMVIILFFL